MSRIESNESGKKAGRKLAVVSAVMLTAQIAIAAEPQTEMEPVFVHPTRATGSRRPQWSGPETPFPFAVVVAFPWSSIQGVWQATGTNGNSLFSFEVKHSADGRTILEVSQIDRKSGAELARGVAEKMPSSEILTALMSGPKGEYTIYIASYTSPLNPWQPQVFVTVRHTQPGGAKGDLALKMRKLSGTPINHKSRQLY